MKRKGLINSIILAVLLGAGFGLVWGISAALITAKILGIGKRTGIEEILRFGPRGEAIIQTYRWNEGQYIDEGIRYAEGGVPDATMTGQLLYGLPLLDYRHEQFRFSRENWNERIGLFAIKINENPELWYIMVNRQGDFYLTGYDTKSRNFISYIGRNGFSNKKPLEAEFFSCREYKSPVDQRAAAKGLAIYRTQIPVSHYQRATSMPYDAIMVLDENKVYRVDFRKNDISIFHDSTTEKVISLGYGYNSLRKDDYSEWSWRLGIRKEKHIIIYAEDETLIGNIALPPELVNVQGLTWYQTEPGRQFIVREADYNDQSFGKQNVARYWVSENSEIEKREDFVLVNQMNDENKSGFVIASVAIPSPLCWIIGVIGSAIGSSYNDPSATFMRSVRSTKEQAVPETWIGFGIIVLLSILLAVWVYIREGRYFISPSHRVIWIAYVLLFGLPGYAGYRLCQQKPVIEMCPHCKIPAPRDREACPSCGVEFPEPVKKGIEVFG